MRDVRNQVSSFALHGAAAFNCPKKFFQTIRKESINWIVGVAAKSLQLQCA
jgi:hypothetical protein